MAFSGFLNIVKSGPHSPQTPNLIFSGSLTTGQSKRKKNIWDIARIQGMLMYVDLGVAVTGVQENHMGRTQLLHKLLSATLGKRIEA